MDENVLDGVANVMKLAGLGQTERFDVLAAAQMLRCAAVGELASDVITVAQGLVGEYFATAEFQSLGLAGPELAAARVSEFAAALRVAFGELCADA